MANTAPWTDVDDYLASSGTVPELLLMARPYRPEDVGAERLGRDKSFRGVTGELWRRGERCLRARRGVLGAYRRARRDGRSQ